VDAVDEAYMELVLANTQGELRPLEEGLHALGSGMSERFSRPLTLPGRTPRRALLALARPGGRAHEPRLDRRGDKREGRGLVPSVGWRVNPPVVF
jgi:hypothetical protein